MSLEVLPGIEFCGDCWCIPNGGSACPEPILQTIFPDDHIAHLREIPEVRGRRLDCNPFVIDGTCDTAPPLELDKLVCAAEIMVSSDINIADPVCTDDFSYRLHSLDSIDEAEQMGYQVLHDGHCGVCSSFQDLAVYMTRPNQHAIDISCASAVFQGPTQGIACYRNVGFSRPCSTLL